MANQNFFTFLKKKKLVSCLADKLESAVSLVRPALTKTLLKAQTLDLRTFKT